MYETTVNALYNLYTCLLSSFNLEQIGGSLQLRTICVQVAKENSPPQETSVNSETGQRVRAALTVKQRSKSRLHTLLTHQHTSSQWDIKDYKFDVIQA